VCACVCVSTPALNTTSARGHVVILTLKFPLDLQSSNYLTGRLAGLEAHLFLSCMFIMGGYDCGHTTPPHEFSQLLALV